MFCRSSSQIELNQYVCQADNRGPFCIRTRANPEFHACPAHQKEARSDEIDGR